MATAELYIGLMSGTSADSIDAALVDFSSGTPRMIASHCHELPPELKQRILDICQPGNDEIDRQGQLDREIGLLFTDATLALLKKSDTAAADIAAIGSHGQTIRHRPPGTVQHPFSLQIGDPNTIAEKTTITTVADFRRRDIAAGGHGAPLAPAFHQAVFAAPEQTRMVVNIGGMANITYLPAATSSHTVDTLGFDTGPGNVLMDSWIQEQRGEAFDHNGDWAAEGIINQPLLTNLLEHPFLKSAPPKSTGRESFNQQWLHTKLTSVAEEISATDIQATLLEFSAQTIVDSIRDLIDKQPAEIFVCGGGAYNGQLMARLEALLPEQRVSTTQALGIPPEWVEAMAFAWLARQTMGRLPGNLPDVTGAARSTILGGVYFS